MVRYLTIGCVGAMGWFAVLSPMNVSAQIYNNDPNRGENERIGAQMRAQQNQAKGQMQAAQSKVHATFEASEEWVKTETELAAAQTAYDDASKPVLEALRAKPEYKQAVEAELKAKEEVVAKQQSEPNASPAQLLPKAENAMEAASTVTTMEREALEADSNVAGLKAKLEELSTRMNQLKQQRDAAVLSDADWKAAKQLFDSAGVTAAQQRR